MSHPGLNGSYLCRLSGYAPDAAFGGMMRSVSPRLRSWAGTVLKKAGPNGPSLQGVTIAAINGAPLGLATGRPFAASLT
eukprot:COSAG01_NODE_63878_length_278_cov_1.061453_1_plen_78_part_01